MIKDIIILGSTGSIGQSTLNVITKDKLKFRIKLLTTNKNIKKIYNQAIDFNVKKVVVNDKKKFGRFAEIFKKKKIKVFFTLDDALKNNKKKVYFTVSAISGLNGLYPTIKIIKYTKNLGLANKESIICGWKFLEKELKKYNTKFIPLDSEHFSIWKLLKHEDKKNIKKIYLTASGGPFLNKKLNDIKNIKPKYALKHPNWVMGKKISIDSATMMNKIFEVIEAKKIFNLSMDKFEILIHPKSYIHAIVHFKTGLTKFLAHDTTMEIPIANSLHETNNIFLHNEDEFLYSKLNGINFINPKLKNFPLLKILKSDFNNTYYEIILVSINDALVRLYLNNDISYITIHNLMLKLLKKPYFTKYYNICPRNLNDIKNMVKKVDQYLKLYLVK
tara:strand:+ start:1985 stop:3151 length:1167 start_codon:yes stop_codon:yes gene_type:complete